MLRLSNHLEDGTKQVEEFRLRLSSALSLDGDKESIWFRVKFSDLEAKKEALRHDVSIQMVKKLIDANKIAYSPGIEHVALTTRPAIPGLGPWIEDKNDPLIATKELLYEGDFYQDSTKLEFSFDNKVLTDLLESADAQITNKVRIPLQLTHEGDGNGRGEVLQLFKAKRYHEGYTKSLSAFKRFKPNQSLTFLALSLSLNAIPVKASTMGDTVTLDELISMLGVTVAADADTGAKVAAVQAEIKAFLDWKASQANAGGADEAELSANGGAPGAAAPAAPAPTLAQQLEPRKVAMTVSMSAIKQSQSSGDAMLDAYVASGQITPAQKQLLLDNYNTDQVVRLSLSANEIKSPLQKGIELLLSQSKGWKPNGRTPINGQAATLALSANGQQAKQPTGNPMLDARAARS
jgi:hypothetical protein